ncbi:MAG: hypothetical protein KG003_16220 [Bacteroidetes bacterium]|nr:hypothetical protein [Bacteroidota bacterium]
MHSKALLNFNFNHADYYPFGSVIQNRSWAILAYRYGLNGKEKESEGTVENYDFGARIFDARVGRWLSIDPLAHIYPYQSPYNYCANSVILMRDLKGKDILPSNFFKVSAYYSIITKMTQNDALLVYSDVLIKYTTPQKDLILWIVTDPMAHAGPEEDPFWTMNENLKNGQARSHLPPSSPTVDQITFNPFAAPLQQVTNPLVDDAGNQQVFEHNELSLAAVIIHELYFPIDKGTTGHDIPIEDLAKAISALKDYASKSMNQDITDEVAASIMLSGTDQGSGVLQANINKVNTKYGLSLSIESVKATQNEYGGKHVFPTPSELEDANLTSSSANERANGGTKDSVVNGKTIKLPAYKQSIEQDVCDGN